LTPQYRNPSTPVAEMSCATQTQEPSSNRDEQVEALNKPRPCIGRRFHLSGISLDASLKRFAAIAPAFPSGREFCRAQLRCDNDRFRKLQSCISSAAGNRSCPDHSIFGNSGADSALGRIAVSRRMYFRARAARPHAVKHIGDPRSSRSARTQFTPREPRVTPFVQRRRY